MTLPHFIPLQRILCFAIMLILFTSCDTEPTNTSLEGPNLVLKFKFDPNQERLGNLGEPKPLPDGHAGQTPIFNEMGVHYIEISQRGDIPAYNATRLFKGHTTTKGGEEAIDFEKALYGGDGEEFFSIPLDQVEPGLFEHIRMSLSYQNYTIEFSTLGLDLTGTVASFVGANTYLDSYKIKNQTVQVGANKLQGYFAFEPDVDGFPYIEGQAPPGATTVPNPLAALSPIPIGSCLVTGEFQTPLTITGNETEDIVVTVSVSINKSFEWIDADGNDTYNPDNGDQVIDMGVRGLIGIVE